MYIAIDKNLIASKITEISNLVCTYLLSLCSQFKLDQAFSSTCVFGTQGVGHASLL